MPPAVQLRGIKHTVMRAAAAIALLAVTIAACGGGDEQREPRDTREPTIADFRFEARKLCREHVGDVIRGVDRLPSTRAQLAAFERRLLQGERRFLDRLERVPAPAAERVGFRRAIDERRRSIDARLERRRRDGRMFAGRAFESFDRMNLADCAGPGAYGLTEGPEYAMARDRSCRRRLRVVRRAAQRFREVDGPAAKYRAGLEVAERVKEFGRRTTLNGGVPPPADKLDRAAHREVRRAGQAMEAAARAARRGDAAATRRAQRRLRRSLYRGVAAWHVLRIPSCERLYESRVF